MQLWTHMQRALSSRIVRSANNVRSFSIIFALLFALCIWCSFGKFDAFSAWWQSSLIYISPRTHLFFRSEYIIDANTRDISTKYKPNERPREREKASDSRNDTNQLYTWSSQIHAKVVAAIITIHEFQTIHNVSHCWRWFLLFLVSLLLLELLLLFSLSPSTSLR